MEEIRQLTKKDYDEAFALSEFAFQYASNPEEYDKEVAETDTHAIWGYMVDGALAGKVHVVPLHIFMNGKEISMGGIGAVSTWPEYRRSGIAKKLMHRCLVDMKEKGQVISFLHPFHVGFYRKQGWELVANQRKYSIPTSDLRRNWNATGYIRRIDKDIDILDDIYRKYAKSYNGMLARDRKWWEDKVLADDVAEIAIAYNEQGEAEGYIIYKVRESTFTVIDIAYTSMNVYRLIHEFIANHDSMAKTVKLVAPDNDPLPLLLDNPRFENVNNPYMMGRIVDVEGFLKQLPVTKENAVVSIYVEDEFFAENTGTYTIRTKDGVADVTKVAGKVNPGIECSIQQLTVMCMGQRRPTELLAIELISGDSDAVKELEKIIPEADTFLADFF